MSKYAMTNPATGETLRSYATASATDVTDAIDSAFNAYRGWSRSTTPAERTGVCCTVR